MDRWPEVAYRVRWVDSRFRELTGIRGRLIKEAVPRVSRSAGANLIRSASCTRVRPMPWVDPCSNHNRANVPTELSERKPNMSGLFPKEKLVP